MNSVRTALKLLISPKQVGTTTPFAGDTSTSWYQCSQEPSKPILARAYNAAKNCFHGVAIRVSVVECP